jgi:hypothetical protein
MKGRTTPGMKKTPADDQGLFDSSSAGLAQFGSVTLPSTILISVPFAMY